MTGPPEHRKEPQKVTIRQRKLLPQDPVNRHLPEQNNPVVNSNEIIMVTKLPVAEENHLRLRANPIAAGPVLMISQKEAMAANHQAKKENINQEKVRDTQTTAQRAVSAAAKRKASNHAALHTQVARLMTINQREVLAVNHQGKNDRIPKRLPIQAGQVQTTALKEVLTASHPVKKEILNQEVRHTRAVQVLTISRKEVLTVNQPAKKEISSPEDRPIQAGQHLMTGPEEILTASHPVKKENSNQEAHHIRAVQVLTINPKEVLAVIKNSAVHLQIAADLKNAARIHLSVNQKIQPTINQNLNAARKNG
jgi:hypothetical protein